jgi:hypothetical protein
MIAVTVYHELAFVPGAKGGTYMNELAVHMLCTEVRPYLRGVTSLLLVSAPVLICL